MIREDSLRWISSAGGPLIVLQRSSLSSWSGASGTDYLRAGEIDGYTGVIRVGTRDAIVLWGEPLETAYYPRGQEQFLVRWSYGPDDDTVLDALRHMDVSAMRMVEEATVEIVDDQQLIIDAASTGEGAKEWLALALAPRRYAVTTFVYQPSEEAQLLVHSLAPTEPRPAREDAQGKTRPLAA